MKKSVFVVIGLVVVVVLLTKCHAGQPAQKAVSSAKPVQTAAQLKSGKLNSMVVQRGRTVREKYANNSADILHTGSNFGLAGDAENLLWISTRGGAGIEANSIKQDDSKLPVIQESRSDNPTSENVWVRLSYDAFTPPAGENSWAHKDVMVYVDPANAQNAVLAVQDTKEQTKWNIVSLPGYGVWLKKEIDMMLRVTKGL